MESWKTCDNCARHNCHCENLKLWKPIPCPRCGGALSTTREHKGRKYRHCYSCHGEFFLDGNKDDPPIPPNRKVFHRYTIFYCGSCGTRVFMKDRACPSCRKRIDWGAAYQTEKEEKPHD